MNRHTKRQAHASQYNIPQLRFPEFEGEWEKKKLENIAKIERGRFSPRPRNNPVYYNGNIPFVQTSDVVNSFGKIQNYSQTLNDKGLSVSKLFSKGTILITIAANIGYTGVLELDMACPDSLIGITCSVGYHNQFLNIRFSIEQPKLDYLAVAAAQKNINIDFLKPYKFSFPTLPEQQRIASFLTAVDEKLTALKKKKELLEQYKKGIMQKLFSQQLRFKPDLSEVEGDENGNEFPEWEYIQLGKIAKIFDGTHQTPKYTQEGIPFYSVEHVTANNFSDTKYISEKVFENEIKRVRLEKGDILLTRIGDIGTSKYIDWDVKASFYVSLALIKQSEKYNSKFINQYISTNAFKKELWKRTIHVAFPKKINLGEIGNCFVVLPCLEEQTRIANFLSAIDKKINETAKQIEATAQWKKGLLQQMFV